MFVDMLSKDEKQGLVQLITFIAKADGDITEEEMSFLSNYASEYNMPFDIDAEVSLESACAQIGTEGSKIVALQEIIKMALSDGEYDIEERKGAFAISEMLSLSKEKFEEVESWVIEGHNWVHRGEEMVAQA